MNPSGNYGKRPNERSGRGGPGRGGPGRGPRPPRPPPPKKDITEFFATYLSAIPNDTSSELEVRFGTKQNNRPFLKNDYDSVIRRLLSAGFTVQTDQSLLRIQNEYIDVRTGETRMSNVRTELTGIPSIQSYCRNNQIPENPTQHGIIFNQKMGFKKDGEQVRALEFDDFNFRIALQTENIIGPSSPMVQGLLRDWSDNKKTFRYINRVSFHHNEYPFRVDMSMVKSSKASGYRGGRPNAIPVFTIAESDVFAQPAAYEMEIELLNRDVMSRKDGNDMRLYDTPDKVYNSLRKGIQLVMAGLQGSNYPISNKESTTVIGDYMRLVHHDESRTFARSGDFIGPSSVTLRLKNVVPPHENSSTVNIRSNYTVTEKADGDRKLLYIAPNRRVYLITMSFAVEFTGMVVDSNEWVNTILDGEHIPRNRRGEFINLYAAFDIYYHRGIDVRPNHFVDLTTAANKSTTVQFRLPLLQKTIREVRFAGMGNGTAAPMRVKAKTFQGSSVHPIFDSCAKIMRSINDGLFEYETDGLIFTPANLGVGRTDESPGPSPNRKITWNHSFKWKPPEFNTIDFLVTTEKVDGGADSTRWIPGASATQLHQYKTLQLRTGFDTERYGYNNPCGDVMDDILTRYDDGHAASDSVRRETDLPDQPNSRNKSYIPALFFPTEPYDESAHRCNMNVTGDQMLAENGEAIEDATVVEFRYDVDASIGWRWKPIRVRHDKTEDYRRGEGKYGNDYNVANNNWHSIHSPVTEVMITTGGTIPDTADDTDTYYATTNGPSYTRGLRDFHNLYVKRALIDMASKPGDTMIDFAVGKGGDLPKWIHGKLSFVYGVDISVDNIENKMDGCCARYLNYRKRYRKVPDCLFAHADSGKLLSDGTAFATERGNITNNALFGRGAKDSAVLGKGVARMFGRAKEGFDVGSIQFALHYMCKDATTFHTFARNVCDTVKVGGRFIATCYDGKEIVHRLRNKEIGGETSLHRNGKKIWGVVRQYSDNSFEADATSLGRAIDVFQETINKVFREYLVHPQYIIEMFGHYGFEIETRTDVRGDAVVGDKSDKSDDRFNGTGLFSDLYRTMGTTGGPSKNYGTSAQMSDEEKEISFLNRYYVFKKIRKIDSEEIYKKLTGQ
jgi:hypothetical protein